MTPIDLDTLLTPVSAEAPCGQNLDEEAGFSALVDTARCVPKERIVGSSQHEEPSWRELAEGAASYLRRSKDLRLAAVWAKAQLRVSGVVGYSAGIRLVRGLLERYWDDVHPQPDAADGDATMRINALRELCDRQSVLLPLRNVVLVSVPALGSYSFREISAASDAARSGSTVSTYTKIEAALNNCDTSHLHSLLTALQTGVDDLRMIEALVADKLGSQHGLRFEELTNVLAQMRGLLAARMVGRERPAAPEASNLAHAEPNEVSIDGLTLQASTAAPLQVRSRGDVQRALDMLCAYYESHEPSSPVPILLKRARRLCTMSFSEIVRDLTPAGSAELDVIQGPNQTDNT